MPLKKQEQVYEKLLIDIGETLQHAKGNAVNAINAELVKANWHIGRHIVEFEQDGKVKAVYGSLLLANLSKDLQARFAKALVKATCIYTGSFILNTRFSRQCLEN